MDTNDDRQEPQWVVVRGNPFDGLWIEGPYDDEGEALLAAERDRDSDWWTVALHPRWDDDEQERADEALGERNAIVPPGADDEENCPACQEEREALEAADDRTEPRS